MGHLSTHVLDTARGCPAAGVQVALYRGGEPTPLREITTDADGRADGPLLVGEAFQSGAYRLVFQVGRYFAATPVAQSDPPFLDVVEVRFQVADAGQNYHVPLLVSPWSYTTYRGS